VAAIAGAVVIVPAAVVVVAVVVSAPVAGGATAVGTVLVSAPVARGATAVVAVFVSAPMPCGQKQPVNGKLQLKLQLKLKFKWNTDGYLGFSNGSLQAALRGSHIDAAELKLSSNGSLFTAAKSTPQNCSYPPTALLQLSNGSLHSGEIDMAELDLSSDGSLTALFAEAKTQRNCSYRLTAL
jgi:hypothetical protein